MRKVYEVFIVAQNRLLRESLFRLLNGKNEVRVVGAGDYSSTVHREIVATRPHIMLLDAHGLSSSHASLIPTLQLAIRNLRIVMVDMESTAGTFLMAVRAGVVGYILKDASLPEVVATIRAVGAGQAVCPPSLAMSLVARVADYDWATAQVSWEPDARLSRREQQIVELLRERLTNKEIAVRLNLSEQTIKNHVHHILRKVGVSNRLRVVERCDNLLHCVPENSHKNRELVNLLTP